jgi:SAM-dependent methyltransferase
MSVALTTDQLRDEWNAFAECFEARIEPFTLPLSSTLLSLVEPRALEEGQLLVEVGCGGGAASLLCAEMLQKQGRGSMRCFDLSPEMIAITQRKLAPFEPQVTAEVGDAESLPLSNGSVDRFFANLTLQLVNDSDQMMREVFRVLKVGGRAAFSIWGRKEESPMMRIPRQLLARYLPPKEGLPAREPFHLGGNQAELRKKFLSVGFSSCQIWQQKMVCVVTSGEEFCKFQCEVVGFKKALATLPQESRDALLDELTRAAQEVLDQGYPICLETEIIFVTK